MCNCVGLSYSSYSFQKIGGTVTLIMTYIINGVNQILLFIAAIFAMITSDEVAGQMARPIPLCVTADTVREYRKSPSKLLIDTVEGARSIMIKADQTATPAGGVPNGRLEKIWYGKILTNAEKRNESDAAEEYKFYTMLNQWLHLKIEFKTDVKVLIVQAMVNPYGLPWGVFDLEFACMDCTGGGINIEDGREGYALSYGGAAVPIPCSKRAYLNPRHPYVYTYDGSPRKEFHLNFNFVDIPCRNMSMLQFLIISADDSSKEYARTAVIDHINQDSEDGMPYPYHVRFYNSFSCHTDEQKFKVVKGGDTGAIIINKEYDDCVLASPTEFEQNHKDTMYYLSDWVCKKPERIRCESYDVARRNDPTHQNIGPPYQALCVKCQSRRGIPYEEGVARVLTKLDGIRRFHGFCMTFGTISLSVVSIHVARYFKETRGCCLLIGWWFWVHLVLMYVSTGAILTGSLLGIFMPPRVETEDVPGLNQKRNHLRMVHIIIGVITALICYPACVIVGPIRPKVAKKRIKFIWSHTVLGYLTVALGILATYISPACFQVTLYAILSVVVAFLPYMAACAFQVVMDKDKPLNPRRRYVPVIEATFAQTPLPMAIPRAVVLGLLSSITLVFVILNAAHTWGEYGGAFGMDICANCLWKWDDPTHHNGETGPVWERRSCPRIDHAKYVSESPWLVFMAAAS